MWRQQNRWKALRSAVRYLYKACKYTLLRNHSLAKCFAYAFLRAVRSLIMHSPTNKNGKFSQIGKKPKGLSPTKK